MSEPDALAQKLALLATREPVDETGARVISEGGAPAPVAAILGEIDNTVLERCLVFECGQATVKVVAAGRRLRGFFDVSPRNDAAIIGQVLSREEPEGLQQAHDLMQEFCGKPDRITVRSTPPEAFGQGGERGISAAGLATLWDVVLESGPKPPIEQFLTANAAAFSSVLHLRKGEIISTAGDFEALQSIWSTQVDAFRGAHKKTIRGEEGAQLICLNGAFEDGSSVAMVLYEDDIVLVACGADSFGAMQSSWHRIFA